MVEFLNPQLTPSALAAGQVSTGGSQALAGAASAMQGVAQGFTEFYEKEAAINRERILAQAQQHWTLAYAERAQDAGPGFAKSMMADFKGYVATAMQDAPLRGRKDLEFAFEKYGMSLETRALEAEAAARARAKAAAIAEAKKARGAALAAEKRMKGNALVSDPSQLQEFMDADPDNAEYYAKIALDARMMDDPASVRDEVQSGVWDNYMSPDEKMSFIKGGNAAIERAAREQEAALAVEQKALMAAHDEEFAYTMANGAPPVDSMVTDDAIDAMFPPEQAAEVKAGVARDREYAETLYSVNTSSIADLQAKIDEAQAAVQQPGRTQEDVQRRDALITAIDARNKALTDDAASFVLGTSDETKSLFSAYEAADPDSRDIAASGYAAARDHNYDRLGVPPEFQRAIPKQAAASYAEQFNKMAPDIAAQSLTAFIDEWGADAPRVANEMAAAGLAPELAVAARFTDKPGLAAQIVSLRGQTSEMLKDGVASASVTDGNAALIEELATYRAVFEAGDPTGTAAASFGQTYGVAERLMLQQIRSGVDPVSAAQSVAATVFPEVAIDEPNARVIVPTDYDEQNVRLQLDAAMTEDALRAFDPAPIDDPRFPQFVDKEVMVAAAQNGLWLNSSTGDGAVLHLNVGGYYIPVLGANGIPYEVKFGAGGPARSKMLPSRFGVGQ